MQIMFIYIQLYNTDSLTEAYYATWTEQVCHSLQLLETGLKESVQLIF